MTMREQFDCMIEERLDGSYSAVALSSCVAWSKENDPKAKFDFSDDGLWLEIKFSDGSDVLLQVEG